MADEKIITQEIIDEFKGATRIKGVKRVLVTPKLEPDAPTVFFGLENLDGNINYFCCSEDVMPSVAREMMGLSMASALPSQEQFSDILFSGPKRKIMHAVGHIEMLRFVLSMHTHRLRFKVVPLPEKPGYGKLTLSEPCPPGVPLLIGDAVHNLRSSLDLLICDIARLRNKSHRKRNFPFAENQEKFEEKVVENFARLGADVVGQLLSLQAYTGGNIELRGLHDLDNFQKHELIVPIIEVAWGAFDMAAYITDELIKAYPKMEKPKLVFAGDHPKGMQTLHRDGEIVPLDFEKYSYIDTKRTATALLDDKMPFSRQHILDVLQNLTNMTMEIVSGFEPLFARAATTGP